MSNCNTYKNLSSGVLNTVAGQTAAHLEILNLGFFPATFRYQILNWNSGTPVVAADETVIVAPNRTTFRTVATPAFHYELRVQHPGDPNLIINHFAVNAATFTLPGLTLTQKDLMVISSPLI
ncbi:hypothetical protein [Bacillus sp. 1P06AnD]|uniref:hypothetical protein n=1 Tax=Bacillus sp. 1P06AnD TaxID=3132208 RepID=UPI0039A207B1